LIISGRGRCVIWISASGPGLEAHLPEVMMDAGWRSRVFAGQRTALRVASVRVARYSHAPGGQLIAPAVTQKSWNWIVI
jgi:hypothetical protein